MTTKRAPRTPPDIAHRIRQVLAARVAAGELTAEQARQAQDILAAALNTDPPPTP